MCNESCLSCRYALFSEEKRTGDCRYNPPNASGSRNGYPFPKIGRDWWCGKFTEITEDKLMNDDTGEFIVVSNQYAIHKIKQELEDGIEYSKNDVITIAEYALGLVKK